MFSGSFAERFLPRRSGAERSTVPVYSHPIASVRQVGWRGALASCAVQLFVLLSMFWTFLTRDPHFSVDGYINWEDMGCDIHLNGGRLVAWFLTWIQRENGWSSLYACTLTTILFMAFCALLGMALTCMICVAARKQGDIRYVLGISFAVSFSFANMFMWEWYTFVESFPWYAAAIGFAVASVGPSVREGWPSAFLAVLLLSLATMSYQIAVPMAGIWAVIVVLAANEFTVTQKTVREGIRVVSRCVAGGAVGIAIPKLLSVVNPSMMTRGVSLGIETLVANARSLAEFQTVFWVRGHGVLPHWSQVAFLLFFVCAILYGQWRSGRGLRNALSLLLVLFGCYLLSIVHHLAVDTFWPAPRTLAPIGCFGSALIVCAFDSCWRCVEGNEGQMRPRSSMLPVVSVSAGCMLLLLVHAYSSHGATIEHFVANDSDIEWGEAVNDVIDRYEEESGVRVTEAFFANDISPTYDALPNPKYVSYMINVRAAPIEWATVYLVDYCGDRLLGKRVTKMTEAERDAVFGKDRDDTEFDESQVICEGNRVYILVY